MFAQMVVGLPNLPLARQKYQDVARCVAGPKFVHGLCNGIVQVVFTRFFKGTPPHFNGKGTSRHHDDGGRPFAGSKVLCKAIGIDGGRGHHHFEVGPAGQNLANVAQQEINVQAAFVGLVNDDRVVGFKQRVVLGLGQQNTVGHQLDRCILRQAILKTHLVAHHIAQGRFELFGNPFGHTAGCNAPRLGMANPFTPLPRRRIEPAAAQGQGNLGQLRGFARTGLAADDDDLVICHGLRNFVALCRHWQRLRKLDFQGGGGQWQNFCKNQGWRKA